MRDLSGEGLRQFGVSGGPHQAARLLALIIAILSAATKMSVSPKLFPWVLLMPMVVAAAEPVAPPIIVTEAQANGLSFAKPMQVTCEFKAAHPDLFTPELKALLVREGFEIALSVNMNGETRQVTGVKVVAKRSGLIDAQSLSSLVQQAEALTKGKPGVLSWSLSQSLRLP